MDTLHLPGVKTEWTNSNDGERVVTATVTAPADKCPKCSHPKLYEFGTRSTRYIDLPIHGDQVLVNLKRQRYRCRNCGFTFMPTPPGFDGQFRMTTRAVEWVEREASRQTFAYVSQHIGIEERSVRRVFWRYAQQREKEFKPLAGRIVGIDELYLLRQFRCIVTDLGGKSVTDLLKTRDQATVVRYLKNLAGRDQIERVCIDMWRPYQKAVEMVLPGIPVTVDKFHVLKEANLAMEEIRKETQRRLPQGQKLNLMRSRHILLRRKANLNPKELQTIDRWKRLYPALIDAWELKEQFFRIYDEQNPADARKAFTAWVNDLPLTIHHQFKALVNTVDNWSPQIFNYFDQRITNAFTECANGMAKVANRTGRGYSFRVIRFKLLFSHDRKKPASDKMTVRSWLNANGIPFSTFDESLDDDV